MAVAKFNLQDGGDYSSEFGPLHMSPWVVIETLTNGKIECMNKDLSFEQAGRYRMNALRLSTCAPRKEKRASQVEVFPTHVRRLERGEGVLVP